MHRSFKRLVILYHQNNLVMQTNYQIKNISSSYCCKQCNRSPITNDPDDVRDIPQYVESKHQRLSKFRFIGFLTNTLFCPPQRATKICADYPKFSHRTMQDVSRNMNFLTLKNVTQEVILDNPWMLIINHGWPDQLKTNIHILEEMQPKNINDFAPLAIIPSEKLRKIQEIAEDEASVIPNSHRIYYFSALLHVNPSIASKYVSDAPFILEMPFKELDSRMKAMMEYIAPEDIINYLETLRFSTSKIVQAKESHLSTKAFRECRSEKTLSNLINQSNEKKAITGKSIAHYYSGRLKCDIETIETMLNHANKLRTMNMKIIEEKLDYLLNEAGIAASDIVRTPHILLRSLETTKERIQELQSLGCHNRINLSYIIQNTKAYNEYLGKLKNRLKNK